MDYNAICMGFGGRLTSFREKRIVKSAKNVVRMRKVLSDNDLNGKNKNVGGNHEKYLLSILVAFCMVLCLTPMAAFADDVPMTINIDVGG